jgi:hypothetical protein
MAACFLAGSACFLIAPFAFYSRLVGSGADAATYFAGSIPFTVGAALQAQLGWATRGRPGSGRALWWSAVVQLVGTVFFNLTTERAMHLSPVNGRYDTLVWRPNAYGSVCFLISGIFAYAASPRDGWRPRHGDVGSWESAVNLLGCVLFGISAIAGFAEPRTGNLIGPHTTDWATSLGALCFLGCAVGVLVSGKTFRSPRLRRFESIIERDVLFFGVWSRQEDD